MGDGVDQCVGTWEQKKQEYIYIYNNVDDR